MKKLLLYFSFFISIYSLFGQTKLCRNALSPGAITATDTSIYYFYIGNDGDGIDAADANIDFTGVDQKIRIRVYKDGGDKNYGAGAGDDILVLDNKITSVTEDSTIIIDDATHDKGDKYFLIVTRGDDGFAGTINYFIKGSNNGLFGEPSAALAYADNISSGCLGATFNVVSSLDGDVGDSVIYQRTDDDGNYILWPLIERNNDTFSITPSSSFKFKVKLFNECTGYDLDDDGVESPNLSPSKPSLFDVSVDLNISGSACIGDEITVNATSSYSGGVLVAMDEWDFFIDDDDALDVASEIIDPDDHGANPDIENSQNYTGAAGQENPRSHSYDAPSNETIQVRIIATTDQCGEITKDTTLSIFPEVSVSIAEDSQIVCQGVDVDLTANAIGVGDIVYDWSSSGNGAITETPVGNILTVSGIPGGLSYNYAVKVTDDNGCSDSTGVADSSYAEAIAFPVLTISPMHGATPIPDGAVAGDPNAARPGTGHSISGLDGWCVDEEIVFDIDITSPESNFTIACSSDSIADLENVGKLDNLMSHTVVDSNQTLVFSVTSDICTEAQTDTFIVTVHTNKHTTSADPFCINNTTDLHIANFVAGSDITWIADTLVTDNGNSTVTTDLVGDLSTYTYSVTVVDDESKCTSTVDSNFTAQGDLPLEIIDSAIYVCDGSPYSPGVQATGAAPGGFNIEDDVTYTWTVNGGVPPLGDPGDTSTFEVTPNVDVIYDVFATNGVCNFTDSTIITVTPIPAVNAGVSDSTIVCAGNYITLTDSGGSSAQNGTITYNWSVLSGAVDPIYEDTDSLADDTTNITAVVWPSGSANYRLVITDSNGVCENVDSIAVTVQSKPVIDLSAITTNALDNTRYCYFGDAIITLDALASEGDAGVGGYTYNWVAYEGGFSADALNANNEIDNLIADPNSDNTSVTFDPSSLTSYYNRVDFHLTVENSLLSVNGLVCATTDSSILNIHDTATISADPSAFCIGQGFYNTQIAVLGPDVGSNFDWGGNEDTWELGEADGVDNDTLAIDLADSVGLGAKSYLYTLSVSDPSTLCTDTLSISLDMVSGVTVDVTTLDTTSCSQAQIDLNANVSPLGADYNWILDGDTIASVSDTSVVPVVTEITSFTYTLVGQLAGCSEQDQVTLTVHPIPTAIAPDVIGNHCSGASVSIGDALNDNDGSDSIFWAVSNASLNLSDSSIANPTITPVNIGSYTYNVIVTDTASSGNACFNTDTGSITVIAGVTMSFADDSLVSCSGVDIDLNSIATPDTSNSINFTWSSIPNDPSLIGNTDTLIVSPTVANLTAYTYKVIGNLATCSDSDSIVVSVHPLPTAIAPDVIGNHCSGATVSIGDASNINDGSDSIFWAVSNASLNLSDSSIANPTITPVNIGSYTYNVLVTDTAVSGNACFNTDTGSITVIAGVTMSFADDSLVSCSGVDIDLNSIATPDTSNSINFTWSSIPNDPSLIGNTDTLTVNPTVANLTAYTYKVIGNLATCSDSDSIVLSVYPLPTALAPDVPAPGLCIGDSAFIGDASNEDGSNNISWVVSDASLTISNAGDEPNPLIKPNTAGSYTYIVTVADTDAGGNSCAASDTGSVTVNSIPTPTINITDDSDHNIACIGEPTDLEGYCFNQTLSLSYEATNGSADYTISWDTTAGLTNHGDGGTFDGNSVTADLNIDTTTSYELTVTDANGCIGSTSKEIKIYKYTGIATEICATDPDLISTISILDIDGCVGMTYTWSSSNPVLQARIDAAGFSTSQIDLSLADLDPSESPFMVSCIVNEAGGCQGSIDIPVVLGEAFTVQIDTDLIDSEGYCIGETVDLQGLFNGDGTGAVFNWQDENLIALPDDGNPDALDNTYSYQTSTPGNFTFNLEVTKNGCTSNIDPVTVIVHPTPVANISVGGDSVYCDGEIVNLDGTASTYEPSAAFLWTTSAGNDPDASTKETNATSLVISDTVTVTFTIAQGVGGAQCNDQATIDLIKLSLPDFSASSPVPEIVCNGNLTSIELDGASTTIGVSYQWAASSNGVVNFTTPTNQAADVFATIDSATTFNFSVTDTNGCQTDTNLVVLAYDMPTINGVTNSFCTIEEDKSAELVVTPGDTNNAHSYDWTVTDDATESFITSLDLTSDTINFDLSGQGIGTYTFRCLVTDLVTTCSQTVEFDVVIAGTPSVNISLLDSRYLCEKIDSVRLFVQGATNYTWSVNPADAGLLSQSNQSLIKVSPPASIGVTTNYIYTVIGSTGSCTDEDTVHVSVKPKVFIDAGEDQILCSGNPYTLGGNNMNLPGYDYTWNNALTLDDANIGNPSGIADQSLSYIVNVTSDDGCQVADTVEITVAQAPEFSFVTTTPKQISCSVPGWCASTPVAFDYKLKGGSGDYTFNWSSQDSLSGVFSGDTLIAASDSIDSSGVMSANITATYDLTILDNIRGCQIDTSFTFEKLNPSASWEDLCENDNALTAVVVFDDVCDASYDWALSGADAGLVSVADNDSTYNIDLTGKDAGTYSFTVEIDDADKGCMDVLSIDIDISETFSAQLNTTDSVICGNETDTLFVTGDTAGLNYLWMSLPNDTLAQNNLNELVVSPRLSTTYQVTMMNGGCEIIDSVRIINNNNMNISVVQSDDSVCTCATISLDGSASVGSGDVLYTWTSLTSNALSSSDSNYTKLAVCNTDTITFSMHDTATNCIIDTQVFAFTTTRINPVISINPDTVCRGSGDTVFVSGSSTSGGGVYQYLWSYNDGDSLINNINAENTFLNAFDSSYVSLTVIDLASAQLCDTTISQLINIYPPASVGGTQDIICFERLVGQEHVVALEDFNPVTGSVNWLDSPDSALIQGGSSSMSQSFITIMVDTLDPASYFFNAAVMNDQTGCPDTLIKEVKILEEVEVSFRDLAAIDSSCSGAEINIFADTVNASEFVWTLSADDLLIDANRTNDTISFTPDYISKDSVIQVMVEAVQSGCRDTAIMNYFIKGRAYSFAGFDNDSICQGTALELDDAYLLGGSVTWSSVTTGTFSPSINDQNPIFTPDSSVTDSVALLVTISDTLDICPDLLDTLDVYVAPRPMIVLSMPLDTICSTDTIDLTSAIAKNVDSLVWEDSAAAGSYLLATNILENRFIPSSVIDTSAFGLTIKAYGSKFCEVKDTGMYFTLMQTPIAQFQLAIDTLCQGGEIALNDTIGLGIGDSLVWDTIGINGRVFGDDNAKKYENSVAGTDSIIIRVISESGCTELYSRDTIRINTFKLPTLSVEGFVDSICETAGPFVFLASNSNGDSTRYYWNRIHEDADTQRIQNILPNVNDDLLAPEVEYEVIGEDIYGCIDTISKVITILGNPKPEINAIYDDAQCYPKTVEFMVTGIDETISTSTWNFRDGGTSAELEPTYIFDKTGGTVYPVLYDTELLIDYDNGCTNGDSITIKVCEKFDLPNIFSPNGDGVNDAFVIPGFNELEGPCHLTVFNRWGKVVWESDPNIGYQNDWLGDTNTKDNNNGDEGPWLSPDIYYYIFSCDGEAMWSGWVSIIDTNDNPNNQ